jgi:hypothetical protein
MFVDLELYMQQASCRLMVWGKEWFKLFIVGPSNLIFSPLSPPMTTAMPSMRKIEETARWVAMTRTTEQSRTPDSASLSSSLRVRDIYVARKLNSEFTMRWNSNTHLSNANERLWIKSRIDVGGWNDCEKEESYSRMGVLPREDSVRSD